MNALSKTNPDEYYMQMAIGEARKAADKGEVPVGAIIVHNGEIIAKAHNQVEMLKDATAHAEMIAITQAANTIGDWRLTETILYVTKEPCPMCSGAILLSRIPKLVFGVSDDKLSGTALISEVCNIRRGIKGDECKHMLQEFFTECRATKKQVKEASAE